jgi:hypothetical protein
MDSVDISPPDEYYPTIRYLCPGCSDDGRDLSDSGGDADGK